MQENDSQNLKNKDGKQSSSEAEEISYQEDGEAEEKKIEIFRKKLKDCLAEKEKYLAGWQRAQADFINYRRRQEEQMDEWQKMFGGGLIKNILPVLDSLDAALASQPGDEGLKSLAAQLKTVLKKHGLEEIKSVGEKFNPEIHEVVECEEGDKNHEAEIVAQEIHKGYMLNGKVLRPAKVKVTKK